MMNIIPPIVSQNTLFIHILYHKILKIQLNNSKVGLKNNEDRDKFFDYIIPNKNLDKKKSLVKSLNELNKIIEKNKNDNR
jgi:hypothetical protein